MVSASFTSLGSLVVAAEFDVDPLAKLFFLLEGILWFATTVAAFIAIRRRRMQEHREWMIRSFALAFFFVTGGVRLDVFEGTSLYPLSVLLSWAPNWLVAEWWINRTRSRLTGELRLNSVIVRRVA